MGGRGGKGGKRDGDYNVGGLTYHNAIWPESPPLTNRCSSIIATRSMLPSAARDLGSSPSCLAFLSAEPPRKIDCVSSTTFHRRAVRSRLPTVTHLSCARASTYEAKSEHVNRGPRDGCMCLENAPEKHWAPGGGTGAAAYIYYGVLVSIQSINISLFIHGPDLHCPIFG